MRRAAVAMSLSSSGEWTEVPGSGAPGRDEDDAGGALQQAHHGASDRHEKEHGRGDGDGQIFSAAQGEGLGNEFAEQDVEIGDESEAERYGARCGRRSGVGQALHPAEENAGGDGFADPAEGQAAEGYA
jgi:hypothetical protein